MPCGMVLLDKPESVRSTECVSALRRRLLGRTKAGHGGTLDSTAAGLLVLLVGGATRTSELVMGLPKTYDVSLHLGEERSTDDYSGDVVYTGEVPRDARERIKILSSSFLGTRLQVPPCISAVRVNGERAHKLSRSGNEVIIPPRFVHVTSLSLLPNDGRNCICLRIVCSKGTYVRSIVRDLGRKLGCGAYVLSLVRKSSGFFLLENALSFEELETGAVDPMDVLLPLSRLADHFYSYKADRETCAALLSGRNVRLSELSFLCPGILPPSGRAVVLGDDLFSFGNVLSSGYFEPKTNIPLLEERQ